MTTAQDSGAPLPPTPPGATRGRHALPGPTSPHRLRADLALRPPDAPVIVRRPGWSAAIGQPMAVPSTVLRPRLQRTGTTYVEAADNIVAAIETDLSVTIGAPPEDGPAEVALSADIDVRVPPVLTVTGLIPAPREPLDDLVPPHEDMDRVDYLDRYDGSDDEDHADDGHIDDDLGDPVDDVAGVQGGRHRQPRTAMHRSGRWRSALAVALAVAASVAVGVTLVGWLGDGLRLPFGIDSGDGNLSGSVLASTRERQSVTGSIQPIQDLTVGSCFQDLPDGPGPYSGVEVVGCVDSHDNQLLAVFELADREWPGDLVIADEAQARCRDIGGNVVERAGSGTTEWDFWVLVPTRQGWVLNDDRVVQCMAYDPAGPVEGDVLA